MPSYTAKDYEIRLMRTFAHRLAADTPPRVLRDVTDKGQEIMELVLENPRDARHSLSLEMLLDHDRTTTATLRFGHAEAAVRLDPDEAIAAMEEILADNIVVVTRYKNADAYDNRHPMTGARDTHLYQLPDHAAALAAHEAKLGSPVSFFERLLGSTTGVFEIFRWSESHVITHLAGQKADGADTK